MFDDKDNRTEVRVLSVFPTTKGFSYALFESPLAPEDWGTREIRQDQVCHKTIAAISELLIRFRPDVLVIDDIKDCHLSAAGRRKRIHKAITYQADAINIEVAIVSRKDIRRAFAIHGALNKHDIASIIASKMGILTDRAPKRERKAWESESRRMALFDAVSRALTYYYGKLRDES